MAQNKRVSSWGHSCLESRVGHRFAQLMPREAGTGRGSDASLRLTRLFLNYLMLSEFDQPLCCLTPGARRRDSAWLQSGVSSHSSAPLSLLLSLSANAPTLMWELRQPWENTPTLHTFLKIDSMKRLDWSRSEGGGESEYDAPSADQKWFVGDVITAEK